MLIRCLNKKLQGIQELQNLNHKKKKKKPTIEREQINDQFSMLNQLILYYVNLHVYSKNRMDVYVSNILIFD